MKQITGAKIFLFSTVDQRLGIRDYSHPSRVTWLCALKMVWQHGRMHIQYTYSPSLASNPWNQWTIEEMLKFKPSFILLPTVWKFMFSLVIKSNILWKTQSQESKLPLNHKNSSQKGLSSFSFTPFCVNCPVLTDVSATASHVQSWVTLTGKNLW